MSDYADINREFQAYQDRIAELEAQTAADLLRLDQDAAIMREAADRIEKNTVIMNKAADRIEKLEAALREIADGSWLGSGAMKIKARAALAPEQDK